MENLHIAATQSSPEVLMDREANLIEIKGESFPENTDKFYEPILSWIESYLALPEHLDVTLNMEMIYFNSSSAKVFMDLFDMLDGARAQGKTVIVNWIYDEENENALEAGEEFQEAFESITFNLIEKPS